MCPACLRAAGGARAERWKFSTLTIVCHEGTPARRCHLRPVGWLPAASTFLISLPRSRTRGRGAAGGTALAGLLAVGIAAVIAGSRSFAAIGQWAPTPGPEVLAGLGAVRGPAEESTFRRAFALVSRGRARPGPRCLAAHQGAQAGGRLVIAIDGKAVRGAKDKAGKAPHLVAALAHGIGAVLGQVAVDAKSERDPCRRGNC